MSKPRSVVWNFFTKVTEDGIGYIICSLCKRRFKNYHNTSNLRSHLTHVHPRTLDPEVSRMTILNKQYLLTNALQELGSTSKKPMLKKRSHHRVVKYETEQEDDRESEEVEMQNNSQNHKWLSDSRYDNGNSHADNNEFDMFGKYIAYQLQLLPLEEALQIQDTVQSLVTQARLRTLRAQAQGDPIPSERIALNRISEREFEVQIES